MYLCQDDDSDLEYELEAFPTVGPEASTEAAACVKVNHYNDLLIHKHVNSLRDSSYLIWLQETLSDYDAYFISLC